MGYWIALCTSFLTTAWGQVTYKLFAQTRRIWFFAAAMGLFIVAQLANYLALHRLPIGTVYISTGITQVLILVLSMLVLKEKITCDHVIAALLVVSGLILFSF
jgi:multidrug transporter EmrE-like cation transporter